VTSPHAVYVGDYKGKQYQIYVMTYYFVIITNYRAVRIKYYDYIFVVIILHAKCILTSKLLPFLVNKN